MSRTMFAAVTGSIAGYVVHQKMQGAETASGRNDQELLVAAPLTNIVAAALAGLLSRSAVAAFLVGFALSALNGTKLDRLVTAKIQQQTGQQAQYPTAA